MVLFCFYGSGMEIPFELKSLEHAVRYQGWVSRTVAPFLGARIMEIGAGIGNLSRHLPIRERLILTELDPELLKILENRYAQLHSENSKFTISRLDLLNDDLEPYRTENLDTIVSFNVLEHLEDDRAAIRRLCDLLRGSKTSGPKRLISFVPAHQWAYGSMDKAFGHYRRYSAASISNLFREVAPEARANVRYFNAFGLGGWLVNGRVLKRSSIGMDAIRGFETLCPFLSPIDDFCHEKLKLPFGQSLLAVLEWE
ncbi:MAG: hypothetical protein A2428_08375 [Bdellovibrionales bacterium RIFOXYC1_FULL_54_43]|nr:MAG: hypothetical protein A2428_08375 [Bdellovibrionales bacterium RIFOXYC1_FULL_54_43]OFZ85176.1 MAG: hypothetical protein A2603_06395 [Bdellovibrionales bacterium RIFOXYD1_FULL_55_31]